MRRALLTLMFIFIDSIVPFGQEISDEAKKYYDRGCASLEMIESSEYADYEDSIKEFKKAKELAPNFKDVYLKLGKIYLKLKKYQEAIANYKGYLTIETNTDKITEIKTLINKLEYKAEKARELEAPTYNDVCVGDMVVLRDIFRSVGYMYPTLYTYECTAKDDFVVEIRLITDKPGDELDSDDRDIFLLSNKIDRYRTYREEYKIDAGKRYLNIGNLTLKCYWVKSKLDNGTIWESWYSKEIPLTYLVKQFYKDNNGNIISIDVINWRRGKEGSNVFKNIKPHGTLKLERNKVKPKKKIKVHFNVDKGFSSDAWIGIIPSYVAHGSEVRNDFYKISKNYLKNRASGILIFKAPRQPGRYDLRMHNSDTTGKEVTYVTFQVE